MNITSVVILFYLTASTAYAQNIDRSSSFYASAWKNYKKYMNEGKTKSALFLTDSILNRAQKEKNFSESTKAWLCKIATQQELSPDSLVEDLNRFESATSVFHKPAEQAIFHILMASAYEEAQHAYTYLADEAQQKIFRARTKEHLDTTYNLLPKLVLLDVSPYSSLLKRGKDSVLFGNDVMSLIVSFVQQNPWIDENYRMNFTERAIQIFSQHSMNNAVVWNKMVLLRMKHESSIRSRHLSDQDYLDSLKLLYTEKTESDVAADVFLAYLQHSVESFNFSQRIELIRWAKNRWPNSALLPNMKSLEQDWLKPELQLQASSDSLIAGVPQRFTLSHRQLKDRVLITVNKIIKGKDGKERKGTRIFSQSFKFISSSDVEEWRDSIFSITLPPGRFCITAKAGNKEVHSYISCSSLKVMFQDLTKHIRRVTVLDALSGHPISNCRIVGWWSEKEWNDHCLSYTTQENGSVDVDPRITSIKAYRNENDSTENACTLYARRNTSFNNNNRKTEQTVLFTDRAIYRPGQTLYATVIAYNQEKDKTWAKEDSKQTISLIDNNGQQVYSVCVRTDSFGTASTHFILPKKCLNGSFTLTCGTARRSILVEEYKRPTFEILFDTLKTAFSLKDTVRITGRARTFSGLPVRNAQVKYDVSTARNAWYRPWINHNLSLQFSDTCTTDNEGRFSFLSILDDGLISKNTKLSPHNNYDILTVRASVDVTNSLGETQRGVKDIRVSEVPFALNIEMPSLINIDTLQNITPTISAYTPQNIKTLAQGIWTLRMWNPELKQYTDTIGRGDFSTDAPIILSKQGLRCGSMLLEIMTTDQRGHIISASKEITIWSRSALTKMTKRNVELVNNDTPTSITPWPLKEDLFIATKEEFQVGDTIDIWLVTSCHNPYIIYTVAGLDSLITDKTFFQNQGIYHQQIVCDEQWEDGVQAMFSYIRNGRMHQGRLYIQKAIPNKQLNLSWKTFRNKLIPGQEETWTLSISDSSGRPISAQFMATLYDASLNAIEALEWPFKVSFSRSLPTLSTSFSSSWFSTYLSIPFDKPNIKTYTRTFNTLFSYSNYLNNLSVREFAMPLAGTGRRRNVKFMDSESIIAQKSISNNVYKTNSIEAKLEEAIKTPSAVQNNRSSVTTTRENFQETAFFYPSLTSNAEGNIDIHFTLPDCITRWTLEGLAHTKDMKYGSIHSSIEAKKDFMIQPNVPRFLRPNDDATISSLITNQTTKSVHGTVTLLLTNPQNDSTVFSSKQPFSVDAQGETTITFHIQIPENIPMLVCEIQAGNKQFTDGERHWLPVLSSQRKIIESHPFYINGINSKEFNCAQLFPNQSTNVSKKKIWIEYLDQPAWPIFLALQTMTQPQGDNSEAWASALYAQTMSYILAHRIPHFKSLLKQWSTINDKDSPIQSELNKNSELKEFLTQETPWVTDAFDESRARESLINLFSQNYLEQISGTALKKLSTLQHHDGGWSWFPGMPSSVLTSLDICYNLARLQQGLSQAPLSNQTISENVQRMLDRGIAYLTNEALKEYRKYYRKYPNTAPSDFSLRLLHLLAKTNRIKSLQGEIKEMRDTYFNYIEKNLTKTSLYQRAEFANTFLSAGKTQTAVLFANSLHEHLVFGHDMGRYFDNDETRASWNDQRISTHIAAIHAFDKTIWKNQNPINQNERNEMLLWLFRQKEGQCWNHMLSTLDACELLLKTVPDSILTLGMTPEITLSKSSTPITIDTSIAGLGYFKQKLEATDFAKSSSLTITSKTKGMHWGCIYKEGFYDIKSIQNNSNGALRITKKWFRYQVGMDSKDSLWSEITEHTMLHIGDRVRLQLTIDSDQDLNFVQIKSDIASCLEPINQKSQYIDTPHFRCYTINHDASSNYFFDTIGKGKVSLNTEYFVTREGNYHTGISTIQCAYNPSLVGHTSSFKINVTK